jgi:hypothetical protein
VDSVEFCEYPRHPALTEERYRVIGVRPDQNVLVVNETDRAVRENEEVVEMVVTVAYASRMFVDGCGKIVEPAPDRRRWRDLEAVTKKPELEAGQLPPQACPVQRRVPRRKVGRLESCEADQRGDEQKAELSPDVRRRIFERAFRIVSPKILEYGPSLAEIVVKEGRHPQTVRGTPPSDFEVPMHLSSNGLRIRDEDCGLVMTIPEPRVASRRNISQQILPANPGFWEDCHRFHRATLAKVTVADNEVGWEDKAWMMGCSGGG